MLHVLVGAECNNNCSFCMESDREGRRRHVSSQSADDIRRFIDDYPTRDEILFTSGEPTLNRDLPHYVGWAKAAGFRTIGVISNGRRFGYARFAEGLLARGLNKITLSIHGHTAALHDSLTRTPGSFEQSSAALRVLSQLKQRWRFDLHSSTVLVRRNVLQIQPIHGFLSQFRLDRMCFNFLMAKGGGDERFDVLMPRYSDARNAMIALGRELTESERLRISIADVPRCAMQGVDPRLLGEQEHFEQFETQGSSGVAVFEPGDLEQLASAGDGRATRLLERQAQAELEGDESYYLTTRELKDDLFRAKRAECARCVHDARCPGVWRKYVEVHGWDEFLPLTAGEQHRSTGT